MKKILFTLTIAITTYCSYAQTNTFPASGNVGIGTLTPAAWATPYKVIDMYGYGYIYGSSNGTGYSGTGYGQTGWGNNSYYDGISHAVGTGAASSLLQGSGYLIFQNAPSVSAGSTQTFTERFHIDINGNVGIGTISPATKLHISGNGASVDGGNAFPINGDDLAIQGTTGGRSTTTGAQLEFVIPANTDGTNLWGQARIITVAGNAGNGNATGEMILGTRRYFNKLGTSIQWYYGNDLTIDGNGFIGINTTNTYGYQLAINGTAIATSMTVKLNSNWPDYVFKKNYLLPSLTEIKTYIDQNHHLPEIPSEQQIEKDGLNLGEMNKLLVKKVEELTLYLIEKDKEIKEMNLKQQTELNKQRETDKKLQKQLNELQNQIKNNKTKVKS